MGGTVGTYDLPWVGVEKYQMRDFASNSGFLQHII